MDSSLGSPWGITGIPVGSPAIPSLRDVMVEPSPVPLGAEELGRELSLHSGEACELEVGSWAVSGQDLISLTLFIRAFDVVGYSG